MCHWMHHDAHGWFIPKATLILLPASQGRPSTDLMFARWLRGSWQTQISDTPMPATQSFGRRFG